MSHQVSKVLKDFRDAFVASLRQHFPENAVKTIAFHDGEFGLAEIENYSRKTPALIVTMEGADEITHRGGSIYDCQMMDAFILTRNKEEHERTDWILIIYEHFLRVLFTRPTPWGSQAPQKVRSANLYGSKLDEIGLALWVVRWEQLLEIPPLHGFSTLDDFARCHVTNTEAQPSDNPANGGPVDEQMIEVETLP